MLSLALLEVGLAMFETSLSKGTCDLLNTLRSNEMTCVLSYTLAHIILLLVSFWPIAKLAFYYSTINELVLI